MTDALADLTGYGRIRGAALRLFAANGVAATSVRAIAHAARVSPGLVQHHYGTKDRLRTAVDRYATLVARDTFGHLPTDDDGLPTLLRDFVRLNVTALQYVARGVADRDPGALRVYDSYVELAARFVSRRAAEHLVVRTLGDVLLRPSIEHRAADEPN